MSIQEAMQDACASVGIVVPRYTKCGAWVQCPVIGKAASNKSGRVLIFDDGLGGIAWNWATGEQQRFNTRGKAGASEARAPKPDAEKLRHLAKEREEIARTCAAIVGSCRHDLHPYLAQKGFPEEMGLVHDDPREAMPDTDLGWRLKKAMPAGDGPFLVVPGRIAKAVTTVQFITPDGVKKNILGGEMGGAAHRIATGRELWVAEGIATALSIRAALRFLGRSATVLSAFSASNVAKVASGLRGAVIAADNDKPIAAFDGLGTGEHWARKSGCAWTMPKERGDFNDIHQSEGLRAVALLLRQSIPP